MQRNLEKYIFWPSNKNYNMSEILDTYPKNVSMDCLQRSKILKVETVREGIDFALIARPLLRCKVARAMRFFR